MRFKSQLKYLFLLGSAVLLSSTTIAFGAAPLRVMRRLYGRWPFWATGIVTSGVLSAFGLTSFGGVVFALTVLVGIYSEVEEHGSSVFISSAIALLASVGASAVTVGAWLRATGVSLVPELRTQLAPLVERMSAMNPKASITVESVLYQLPSGVVIILALALASALIWENLIRRVLREATAPESASDRLLEYRVPDLAVWLLMLAILGAYLQHGNKTVEIVGTNALNIFALVYFFQGLAVVSHAFRIFRVGSFWRGIWYVIIVLQLFLMVSLIGLADFWLDFRERLSRKPAEENKGF